ncbi:ABC transporter substrate-binding protein [Photobacterium aphoticum]|uniref:ABC transporter substrate-binding protein n=2 Tax=Photobacterium aphoticum TaxID=754436 RepID=A0A0J1GMQ9_9GAMM|nr:ABC transporter substrate-binding protein [Photobacterium aphoticum]PSU58940.1 ABC transporter substrate-binding protein [Photobacterium aphoticum]GHA57768.1 ABC transporter substrate-binding protein [Photobacterium aphoticum]
MMDILKKNVKKCMTIALVVSGVLFSAFSHARDLADIKEEGVLRHIGVPYANFISYINNGSIHSLSGLDVEIVKGFADHLGVRYEFIPASWTNVIGKLTGQQTEFTDNKIVKGGSVAQEGDIIANGVTVLPWRTQLVSFSYDYFPSAVWLVARADSDLQPIQPSGSTAQDIFTVKSLMKGRNVLAMEHSCLDPNLYDLYNTQANIIIPTHARKLSEMVPAILNNDAETTLLDVADTLIALEKWPGEIKVIGPVSEEQRMAAAFRNDSPELRKAFNQYLTQIKKDGTYNALVEKYYPSVFYFYDSYFNGNR